jgi:L-lactate dehydrogenase complex protein LldG
MAVRRFAWGPDERLARFQERLAAVHGQVQRVGADWPRVLCDLLRARAVTNLLFGPGGPHGAALARDWPGGDAIRLCPYLEPVETCRAALFDQTQAGFCACRGAIAETGSLVLWPDADEPRLLSLVPPIHVVLLDADAIYSTFAELMDAQGWAQGLPTNALLITGPSKSADIEQTLTYGVHGPKELIVLVREGGQ